MVIMKIRYYPPDFWRNILACSTFTASPITNEHTFLSCDQQLKGQSLRVVIRQSAGVNIYGVVGDPGRDTCKMNVNCRNLKWTENFLSL